VSYKNIFSICLIFAIFFSCADTERTEPSKIEKITETEINLTVSNFEIFGFKISKEYDIEDLPYAVGAWYGFWTPPSSKSSSESEFKAFEIREYANHEDAIEFGVKFVEEVVGSDALLKTSEVSWKEGTRDRRNSGFASGGGGGRLRPKYGSYIIYGNLIILCDGVTKNVSLENCGSLIDAMLISNSR
jgi:hypothetical protein